jgi:hypothetical protein
MSHVETGLLKYFAALAAGLACAFICFALSIYPSQGEVYAHVFLAMLLPLLAIVFSYLYPNRRWYLWFCLILPYGLLVLWKVMDTIHYNARYNGAIGQTQIYWSTVYLFASPIIASVLAPLFNATRLISFALASIIAVGLAITCQVYISNHAEVSVSANRSVLLTNATSRLNVDFRCRYYKSINYLRFSYYEENHCGGQFTVVNKNPADRLTTVADWMIDGAKKSIQMSPIGAVPLAYSPHKYDNVNNWTAALPFNELVKAREVQFSWGDIQIQLQPEQIETLKQTITEFQTAVSNANK